MRLLKVATCSLNQWAMDFDWNINNIKESLRRAREAGAAIRLGPELEITGYGCEDHFFEKDTITHAWECLKELLVGDWTDDMLCSFGMPMARGPELYNCQVLCLNRKIVMIRPKMWLANGGGCSELRWFTPWKQKEPRLDDFLLPPHVSDALSQTTAPFGYGFVQFLDTGVAAEICKELFTPVPVHPELALNGVEVFMNPSGSVHLLEKMERRRRAITSAMSACGGVYMYSNHLGCDGGRVYYDGCSCIVLNGDVIAQGLQFSLKDVDLVVAQLDLDKVTSFRASDSTFGKQASCKRKVSSVFVPYKLCKSFNLQNSISTPTKIEPRCREEEIGLGAACWLWNYLRRSGASGFLLPLCGGVESSAVAAIVGCMCHLVVREIANGDEQVKADALRIGHYTDGQFQTDTKEFAKRIFCTVFMASENRYDGGRSKSKMIAEEIGSWHLDLSINEVLSALLSLFDTLTGKSLRNKGEGGTSVETSALRSIRSRIRMVVAFMLASLLPWVHNKPAFYLVLSTTTADEGLSGNFTKYGCSGGDINPVGSINKQDLGSFLKWAAANLGYSSLSQAGPTDELGLGSLRTSDVGMTEEEVSVYGRLRKTFLCGPVSMFENLCDKWGTKLRAGEIGAKVKHLFKYYAINRHKMTVLTPSYLVEGNSAEDNRFDQRPFLYNSRWPYQFRKIDELLQQQQQEVDGEVVAGISNNDD